MLPAPSLFFSWTLLSLSLSFFLSRGVPEGKYNRKVLMPIQGERVRKTNKEQSFGETLRRQGDKTRQSGRLYAAPGPRVAKMQTRGKDAVSVALRMHSYSTIAAENASMRWKAF